MKPKARGRLTGVAFLVVMALLVWLSIALYNKQFTPVSSVTLYTGNVGNEMHVGAEVMVRGVQVGQVESVTAHGTGAQLELAIQPSAVPDLPANVSAEMLPTTLFGERYVDLVMPTQATTARLTSGSVITEDRSADAIELDRVLNNLLPMLTDVEPDKLSVTLTSIAQGLQGRGAELGQTIDTLNAYLHTMNPQLPKLDTDIRELAGLARTYSQAAPQIVQALNDFTTTNETIANDRATLESLFTNVTTASQDLQSFLNANSLNAIHLSADSLATLRILARYSPEFPCTLSQLAKFVPTMDRALGAGTKQPGLHITAVVVPTYVNARYTATTDTPIYGDNLGPHCYSTPFQGVALNDGVGGSGSGVRGTAVKNAGHATRPRRANAPEHTTTTASQRVGWGDSATLQFGAIKELAAMQLHESPSKIPAWASLLVAPIYEGHTVLFGVSN